MTRPAFGARVADQGIPVFDDPHGWQAYLRSLAGKRVQVTVSRETKGRTLPQNAWLWAAVYPAISDWSGHSVDEIHEAMLQLHGVKSLVSMPGVGQTLIVKRSHDYTTAEFSEYVERVRAWAAMQGLLIPDPGRCA